MTAVCPDGMSGASALFDGVHLFDGEMRPARIRRFGGIRDRVTIGIRK